MEEDEILILNDSQIDLLKNGLKTKNPKTKRLWKNLLMQLDYECGFNRSWLSRVLSNHYSMINYSHDALTDYLPKPIFSTKEGRQFRDLMRKGNLEMEIDLRRMYDFSKSKRKRDLSNDLVLLKKLKKGDKENEYDN